MPPPEIDGYEILNLIGDGVCGSVYMAQKKTEGKPPEYFAVRVFNALAVNRSLIENISSRLTKGSYPEGVAPISWERPRQGSQYMLMPLLADLSDDNKTVTPNSLQKKLADYPKEKAWETIEKIAHALGSMHSRHIPHGNLKPGNIFFQKNGGILLTDFAMGHMPGVGMLSFTDALLHAPLEQLRNPEGYYSGSSYSWDIYAFAVISFRILTGKFPYCDSNFQEIATDKNADLLAQIDAAKIANFLDKGEFVGWKKPATNDRENKRRAILERCLSRNSEERYHNINEVIQAWEDIDKEALVAKERAKQKKKVIISKFGMVTALILAGAGAIGCLILYSQLDNEKNSRATDINELNQRIENLDKQRITAESSEADAITLRDQAVTREEKIRDQLIALGVTNDRLLAWMLRDKNTDLPELQKTGPDKTAADAMERELRNFLELTEGEEHFQPIRARILLQLSELEIHRKNPTSGTKLLDKALPALKKNKVAEPGQDYRIARARLICLMQAQDQKNTELVTALLPKARHAIAELKTADPTETQRIKATMELIDGRLVQEKKPDKALEHFQSAIENLKSIQKMLPENINIRTDLTKHILHSSTLAESLDRIDDATKLRGEAADHLRWLLEKNPDLLFAKVRLAEIEILSAESDLLSGYDSAGQRKIIKAEKLLAGTNHLDFSPTGPGMQLAIAKGLRAILLRDRGQKTNAAKHLDYAIYITNKVIQSNPDAIDPLYRLAEFQWQRAGLAGEAGNLTTEIKLGTEAAAIMQKLLKIGAGNRDNELRRSLAYLYGSLGHTASRKGDKSSAISYYKKAASFWQSLINKNGKKNEYDEGLRWSNKRASELSE